MRFEFHDEELHRGRPMISVDGITPTGPNLSHWPGNRTPPALRHDLSTGIVFRLLDLPATERGELLEDLDVVTNTHIDSDGIAAAFALLHPDVAMEHRELLLDVARTGDFQVFTTEAALWIDLSLTWLTSDRSPFSARWREVSATTRRQLQYDHAFAELPALLAQPTRHAAEVGAALRRIVDDVEAVRDRREVEIDVDPGLGLATVTAAAPLHRVAEHEAAGDRLRVLSVVPCRAGHLYRLFERVESWFDLESIRPPKRRDFGPLARFLGALEASESDPTWTAQPIETPIPECYFGVPGSGPTFGPLAPGELCVSRLKPRLVTHAVREHYEGEEFLPDPASACAEGKTGSDH